MKIAVNTVSLMVSRSSFFSEPQCTAPCDEHPSADRTSRSLDETYVLERPLSGEP
jgi:hypothetical protein